jgi:hypothetical protein
VATGLLRALLLLLLCAEAVADTSKQITRRADPLVRTLEAVYAKSMEVALTGDIEVYWRYRTAASRERPPMLNRERVQLFAQMLPPLDSLQFVRMDTSHGMARALYRWPRKDMARYTVIVYRIEQGWKIDSIVVKTDIVSNPREAEMMEELRRRAAAAQSSN